MLSLAKCRELLDLNDSKSDAELELLRDRLYGLARVVGQICPREWRGKRPQKKLDAACQTIDGAAQVQVPPKPEGFFDALAMLPEEDRYAVQERAAIHEFDGGLERDTAERAAFSEYWRAKHRRN